MLVKGKKTHLALSPHHRVLARCHIVSYKNLAVYDGTSAMLAGGPSDLTAIRNYLDAERGRW